MGPTTDEHIRLDVTKFFEIVKDETSSARSQCVEFYYYVYRRLLPHGALYDDVREELEDAYEKSPVDTWLDPVVSWYMLFFFMREVARRAVTDAGYTDDIFFNVLGVPRFLTRFESAEMTRELLLPAKGNLDAIIDDQLASSMEAMFLAEDKGRAEMRAKRMHKVAGILSSVRVFMELVEADDFPRVGVVFALLHFRYGSTPASAAAFIRHLKNLEKKA